MQHSSQARGAYKGARLQGAIGAPSLGPSDPPIGAPSQAPIYAFFRPPFGPLCRLSRAFSAAVMPKAGNFFSRNFFKPTPFYREQLKIETA